MRRWSLFNSVVTRLVACLVLGGVAVSLGLGFLDLGRGETLLKMDTTQRVSLTARNIQTVLREVLEHRSAESIRETVNAFTVGAPIRAWRVRTAGRPAIESGGWPTTSGQWSRWHMPEHSIGGGDEVDLTRLTLVEAPFMHDAKLSHLDLLVDGPQARRDMRARAIGELSAQWVFLAVMTLMGLLMLRRWFLGPLSEVVGLVGVGAPADRFQEVAKRNRGEFAQLAESIADMLARLASTTDRLRKREQAFQSLYELAPSALLSIDPQGKIFEANRRAAILLGAGAEQELFGKAALDFVHTGDRSLLRQAIGRLDVDNFTRCELRLNVAGRTFDALVECTGIRDEDGTLSTVRLALQDVTESKELQRALADKTRLHNLVLNHIADAILLVDRQGRIAAFNQQLATLVRRRPETLSGQPYDPDHFWDELGVPNQELFVNRLRQIDADADRPAQERFESKVGTFLFQGIPVQDGSGQPVGRLWVVQEITSQEQNQRLLTQQANQVQALRKIGQKLNDVTNVDELLAKAGECLYECLGVEALGVALRADLGAQRSIQVLHRGTGPYLLETNRSLIRAIEEHLMPHVLGGKEVSFWPDLPRDLPWAKAFNTAGLTCVAAGPLRGSADSGGILWIARRGGERLERHHIYMLEALAPVVAGRLEIARLGERLDGLELTDKVTGLPNREHFTQMARRLVNRPGHAWAAVLLNIDHFRKLNETLEHEQADALLHRVAVLLQSTLRKSSFVARLGGATFGLLCPDIKLDMAVKLGERIRGTVAGQSLTLPDGSAWPLTASLGVASSPQDGLDAKQVIELAEARVELAKRAGRNRVVADGSLGEKQAG